MKVRSDGREFWAKVWEISGISANPIVGSAALLLAPDGDEGKIVAIAMSPPEDR